MSESQDRLLRDQLVQLRTLHRELDQKIAMLEANGTGDQLSLTRLKKQKLAIKDQISGLEDRLFPDIIA